MLPIGSEKGQCRKCGRYFNSLSAFDKHQTHDEKGNVICRDPEQLGMMLTSSGHWATSEWQGGWLSDAELEQLPWMKM